MDLTLSQKKKKKSEIEEHNIPFFFFFLKEFVKELKNEGRFTKSPFIQYDLSMHGGW